LFPQLLPPFPIGFWIVKKTSAKLPAERAGLPGNVVIVIARSALLPAPAYGRKAGHLADLPVTSLPMVFPLEIETRNIVLNQERFYSNICAERRKKSNILI
jgi:hypothetical protein